MNMRFWKTRKLVIVRHGIMHWHWSTIL